MKVSDIGLKKGEEKIVLFYTEDTFYIGVKGKGLFKVLEIEEYIPKMPKGKKTLKGKANVKIEKPRDERGRFIKCS